MNKKLYAALLPLALGACDGADIRDKGVAGGDASPGGADAAPPRADGGTKSTWAFVVAGGPEGNGISARVDVDNLTVERNPVAGIVGGDPVVRAFGERIYIVDRLGGDNVTVLESDLSLVAQISTGVGSNPQDVAVDRDILFVPALDAPGVVVLDLSRPEAGVIETIDLSEIDEVDGIPDCASAYIVGNRLFVACSRFERTERAWIPRGPGVIAVIDVATKTLESTFELSHPNPFGWLQPYSGGEGPELLVSTVDFSDFSAGCLERIDTAEARSGGCLFTHEELGGYAGSYGQEAERLWVVVGESFTTARAALYDSAAKKWIEESALGEGRNPVSVGVCSDGRALVAENTAVDESDPLNVEYDRGLRVFSAQGDELTSATLDLGLPEGSFLQNGIVCP